MVSLPRIPTDLLRELRQDLHYATRAYRHRAVVTLLAVIALALAIGAATGVFSVVNALLPRSLPFREPDRLAIELREIPRMDSDIATFDAWRYGSAYLEDAAAYKLVEMNVATSAERSGRVNVAETTANFFSLLGIKPAFGRTFLQEENDSGEDNTAVIGYGVWQQLFGGSPQALGSSVRLNGAQLTVIGVAPPGFDYPEKAAVWTPTMFDRQRLPKAGSHPAYTIGRLRRGVTLPLANHLYTAELRHALPGMGGRQKIVRWTSLQDQLAGKVRQASLVLMGVVAFVLLIASANVAQFLLSRLTERYRELVIRLSLGATRARLLRQLTTESTVLTLVAATAGLEVAYSAARLAMIVQPPALSAQQYTILDWRVLAFAIGLAILIGIVFGAIPASVIGRLQSVPNSARTHGSAPSGGVRRIRAVLLAAQSALTLVLVAGSLILGRAFVALIGTDLGFHTRNVASMSVSLSGTRYEADHREEQYYRDALERLRGLPGVESAGGVQYLPLVHQSIFVSRFQLDSGTGRQAWAILDAATPGYFTSIGTGIVEGRDFTEADQKSAPVAIVNEELARKIGHGSAVIGHRLRTANWGEPPRTFTIIGIVQTTRFSPMTEMGGQVYVSSARESPAFLTLVARVHGNSEQYLAVCRDAIQRVDPQVPVFNVETFDQRLQESLTMPRFYTTVVLFFAVFSLLLAVIGTYGGASYSIAQRTHEVGVRLALGASPGGLRGVLLRQSMMPIIVGMLAGIAAAAALGRSLQHLVVNAKPTDLSICVLAACVLGTTATVAIWVATAQIMRMDPSDALRIDSASSS